MSLCSSSLMYFFISLFFAIQISFSIPYLYIHVMYCGLLSFCISASHSFFPYGFHFPFLIYFFLIPSGRLSLCNSPSHSSFLYKRPFQELFISSCVPYLILSFYVLLHLTHSIQTFFSIPYFLLSFLPSVLLSLCNSSSLSFFLYIFFFSTPYFHFSFFPSVLLS